MADKDFNPLGTWIGKGLVTVTLPHLNTFKLIVKETKECFKFHHPLDEVMDRGSKLYPKVLNEDIKLSGLTYIQKVDDLVTNENLHLENGFWMEDEKSIIRLGSVPHGDSFVNESSTIKIIEGQPKIKFDKLTLLPTKEFTEEFETQIKNPNKILKKHLKGLEILKMKVVEFNDCNKIVNSTFVEKHANVKKMNAIFWFQIVRDKKTNEIFKQLQYSQTIYLDFLGMSWPHITVGTLKNIH